MSKVPGGEAPGLPGLIKALLVSGSALPAPELLAAVLDELPLGVALYDAGENFNVLYLNAASMQFAPPHNRRPIGRPFIDVFPDAAHNRMLDLMAQVRDSGVAWHVRDMVTSSGRVWNVDLFPLRGDDGNTGYLLLTGQEITDHAQAETRLRLLLESTQALMQAMSPAGVAEELAALAAQLLPELESSVALLPHDRQSVLRIAATNSAWAATLQGEDLDVSGTVAGEAVTKLAPVEANVARSRSQYRELMLASGVGMLRAVPLLPGQPLPDGRGCLGALVFYTAATTPFNDGQRSLMDDLARRGGLALHRAERQAAADRMTQRLQLAVDTAIDLSARLDPEEVARRLLEKAVESLGADRGTIAAVEDGEIVIEASHAVLGTVAAPGQRYLISSQPVLQDVIRRQRPVRASRTSGAFRGDPSLELDAEHAMVVPMVVGGTPLAVGALSRVRDVPFTEDDLATYALLGAVGALALRNARAFRDVEGASAAKTQFMNMAAHELRTPLSVLAGYLSMLRDGTLGPPSEAWSDTISLLSAKADELNRLVDGLLVAARLEAGTTRLNKVSVDLGAEARAAVERAEARARLQGAEIVLRLPDAPVSVRTGPDHLARILDNLINNALAYSPGKPWVRVTVKGGRTARVTVEDRGVGVPDEMRERIFEKFVRVEHEDLGFPGGTGLGLYLSRELAALYGGSLKLAPSRAAKGSRFVLTLPLGS